MHFHNKLFKSLDEVEEKLYTALALCQANNDGIKQIAKAYSFK